MQFLYYYRRYVDGKSCLFTVVGSTRGAQGNPPIFFTALPRAPSLPTPPISLRVPPDPTIL